MVKRDREGLLHRGPGIGEFTGLGENCPEVVKETGMNSPVSRGFGCGNSLSVGGYGFLLAMQPHLDDCNRVQIIGGLSGQADHKTQACFVIPQFPVIHREIAQTERVIVLRLERRLSSTARSCSGKLSRMRPN